MTDDILDVEVADLPDTTAESPNNRLFRVVTHKHGLVRLFEPFGGQHDNGISVQPESASSDLWWTTQDWAVQVLKAGIELPQLTAPTPGWLAKLPQRFLNRQVGTLRKADIPRYYVKHPDAAQEHPQLVLSVPGEQTELIPPQVVQSADLAAGLLPPGFDRLPGSTLLQLDQMLPCVVEARFWIAEGEVTAFAPYRLGLVGWDSGLFLEMSFNADGQKLVRGALDFAKVVAKEVDGPPGYALDVGVTVDGITTVLRAWPAWAAEPLHAEMIGVMTALIASHDFDGVEYEWRWTPDPAVYDRGHLSEPTPEETQPTENILEDSHA